MAASEWIYFTPYETSPEVALQSLRREVFETGRFGSPTLSGYGLESMGIAMRVALGIVRIANVVKSIGRWIKRGGTRYPSIEAAVEDAGENGTHSILDITRIGSSGGPGVAAPLSPKLVMEVFGTLTPNRAQVELAPEICTVG